MQLAVYIGVAFTLKIYYSLNFTVFPPYALSSDINLCYDKRNILWV